MHNSAFKRILGEPFLHFLLLGAGIFVLYGQFENNRPEPQGFDITQSDIETLERQFESTWKRRPSPKELDNLITNLVREEVMVREARALRMDEKDPVIRNRLRQKMEFIATSAASARVPAEGELAEFYRAHTEDFRTPPQIAFEQVMLEPANLGQAEGALDALNKGQLPQDLLQVSLLPAQIPLTSASRVDGVFGSGFAAGIQDLPVGTWAGPVQSGYGVHLVQVVDRIPSDLPKLEDIENQVLARWREVSQSQAKVEFGQRLQDKYQITVAGDEQGAN
ncbi:peptidyl-prolyl cis-trans isomerase [Ruegeria halocynthiae]|uniref:peptidylprolyl isomerase n=1 Tax=Ruegeria halocynthiae TaxID=985054 RepID=UPI0006894D82|nr:peptidylprolyl isomerase [Ruegeria halocynthiae]